MKNYTRIAYRFSELNPEAKEVAKNNHQCRNSYLFSDEAMASIKALAEHFGGKIKDYSIDWSGDAAPSSMDFEMPEEMEPDEIKRRLDALGSFNPETLRGHGDCVLTGYCADEDAIDGLRKAYMAGERDLNVLMKAAFDTWIEACHDDYRGFYEDEQFYEHCEANNLWFSADGGMVNPEDEKP